MLRGFAGILTMKWKLSKEVGNMQPLSEFSDLMTVADIAKLFRISKQTVYKELRNGRYGATIKMGRAYFIPKTQILSMFFTEVHNS